MSTEFDDQFTSNLIGLWEFSNSAPTADTGLADGIAQNGELEGDAFVSGGALQTDGYGDYFDVKGGNDAPFNLDQGTISVQFTQDQHIGSSPDTIVNRGEQADAGQDGWFEISVTESGAVQVWHCENGHDVNLTTGPGFFNPGDTIKATYAWSPTDGLIFNVENLTQNTDISVTADNPGLTLDVTDDDDESFTFGARETDDGRYGNFFDGSIDYVAIYDRDIVSPGAVGDGIVQGDDTDNLIDVDYLDDPQGDRIDNNDAILPNEAPQDDIVQAGGGDDTVLAGAGDDEVFGQSGNDVLSGGTGNNFLSGGTGDDLFVGGDGADTFQGNAGQDNLDYSGSDAAVQINLATGTLSGGDAANDSIAGGIDGAIGSDFDDTLIGFDQQGTDPSDTFTNEFFGGAGNDTIVGSGGADRLSGEADRDVFLGGTNGDVVDGGATGDDFDTLDLSDQGPLRVVNQTIDADGNSTSGTVEFLDSDGNPTGSLEFSEIENLILPNNQDPIALDDEATTNEDNSIVINVLDNDLDPGADPLEVLDAQGAANGTTTVNPDGTITYTPDTNFNGTDTFTYTVSDGNGGTDTATVNVTIDAVNDDPVANDDAAAGDQGADIVVDVLDNDTDVDGDPLQVLDTGDGANGTTVINADGTITYTPNAGFSGTDTFTYTISDGQGGTDTATVTVSVAAVTPDGIVEGTDGDDLIDIAFTGDPDGDRIDALDEILPGQGPNDDIVEAGDGDDTVLAGLGDDNVDGGTGDDDLRGGDGEDTLIGGDGDDTLRGDNGNDTLIGGDGNDTVIDRSGDNVVDTSGGDDPRPDLGFPGLFSADDNPDDDRDRVVTGGGNDSITTGDDADTIRSGAGDDTIDAGFDADDINAGSGDDVIIGGEGSDTILGGAGNDTIFGGIGPDAPDAINIPDDGSGPFGPDPVTDNGRDFINAGTGDDVVFGEDDDDTILGGSGDDTIDGGIDDDLLQGQGGDDVLIGGQGDDTILGGAGDDQISGGLGQDDLIGGADRDTFTDITAGDVIDGNESGDDFDTLDLTGAAEAENPGGSLLITFTSADQEDGFVEFTDADGNVTGTAQFANIENVIPCFTPGTAIATPKGERRVEDLQVGDRIITRDNGLQEIRWVGHRGLSGQELVQAPHLKPVLIRAGALGHGLPERDMLVSPQHRILIHNDKTALYFEEREVLAAAKHLTDLDGVDVVDTSGTTYIHFMFDQHEVVLSNGAWTESFQPGEQVLDGMGAAQRDEIYDLFPELSEADGLNDYQAARRSLKRHEARLLVK